MEKAYPNDSREADILLKVLTLVEADARVTQRSIAGEVGIALGLANTYLKRCIKKGYVKVHQIPANRYAYYLTPQGFAEKSKLTAEYLYQSLSLFRLAKAHYRQILSECVAKDWKRIALCGCSDLAEITILLTADFEIEIAGICEPGQAPKKFHGYDVIEGVDSIGPVDAWVVTSMENGQQLYDMLVARLSPDVVLAPPLLHIARKTTKKLSP